VAEKVCDTLGCYQARPGKGIIAKRVICECKPLLNQSCAFWYTPVRQNWPLFGRLCLGGWSCSSTARSRWFALILLWS